jgi:hypothetical protein
MTDDELLVPTPDALVAVGNANGKHVEDAAADTEPPTKPPDAPTKEVVPNGSIEKEAALLPKDELLVPTPDALVAVGNANGKHVEDAAADTEPPTKPPDAPTKEVVPNGSIEKEAALLPKDELLVPTPDALVAVGNANGKHVEDAAADTEPPTKPPDAPTKEVVPNGSIEKEAALLPKDELLVPTPDALVAVGNANGKHVEDAAADTEPPTKPPDAPTKEVVPNGSIEKEAALLPKDELLVPTPDALVAVGNANGKHADDVANVLVPPHKPPNFDWKSKEDELICDVIEARDDGKGRGVKQEKRETGDINLALAGGLARSSADAMQSVGDCRPELDRLGDVTALP